MDRTGHGPVRHQKFGKEQRQDGQQVGGTRGRPYDRPSTSRSHPSQRPHQQQQRPHQQQHPSYPQRPQHPSYPPQSQQHQTQTQQSRRSQHPSYPPQPHQQQSQPPPLSQQMDEKDVLPQTPSPKTVAKLLSDGDVFGLQDRLEKVDPYPPCDKWTQRPIDPIFGDPNESMGLGHFYAFFHSLLDLPPINCEDDNELQRAALSPFEKMELWQFGGRFDLVYVTKDRDREERRFRIFLAGKKLTRPVAAFPMTTGEKNYPILLDEDRMNFDVLCLFALKKIAEAKRVT